MLRSRVMTYTNQNYDMYIVAREKRFLEVEYFAWI